GVAVPEALVVALPESRTGEIVGSRAGVALCDRVATLDALLVGPGMMSPRAAHALLAPLVPKLDAGAVLILDAAGIHALCEDEALLAPLAGRAVLTPHAGE